MTGMQVIMDDRRIGRVAAVCFSDDLKRMEGIWTDGGFTGSRFICSENILMLGDIAILADHAGKRGRPPHTSLFLRAVSSDGCRLGSISDAMIDEISFSTDALLLSFGIWEDLMYGRVWIRKFQYEPIRGCVIVSDGISDDFCDGGESECAEE